MRCLVHAASAMEYRVRLALRYGSNDWIAQDGPASRAVTPTSAARIEIE